MFSIYLELGFEHIADLTGYDHILFIVVLCAIYRLSEWKTILVLITAFTVGHSITLALAALKIVVMSAELIEFLIPLTIFLTAVYNVLRKTTNNSNFYGYYTTALFFGLIHGLGFSNFFQSLLGREANITLPLFAFNVGLELGQLIIVMVILGFNYLFLNVLSVKQREWNLFISGAAAGIALTMMLERMFW
jgi:hypothetical protein